MHIQMHSLNRTHRDERILPDALPPKLREWFTERDNRKRPPPLVLAAPFSLVVASLLHPSVPSPELRVGDLVAVVVRLPKGAQEDAMRDVEAKVGNAKKNGWGWQCAQRCA